MALINIPRLVIAGTHSGVGKTTLVTGLLAAFKKKGLRIQSYKVGPDYIDPGYHYLASGRYAHNLDSWLLPDDELTEIFTSTADGNDLIIIEGVMGLYDGGHNGISSTAAIAKMLEAPVVLVVDAKAMGESVAALALGYKLYDQEVNFAGVIVNYLGSEGHKQIVIEALERQNIPVLGCILRDDSLTMPERHLGLTPVEELDATAFIERMAQQISKEVDLDKLLFLACKAPTMQQVKAGKQQVKMHIRVGVAKDEAFSFYYQESLAVLQMLGAELIEFSPLADRKIPDVDGLLLGGGFPEMFAEKLNSNQSMRQSIYLAAKQGMPIYAECGGLMYLTQKVVDFEGLAYEMTGVIPAECNMQNTLQAVGYVKARALNDNVLCLRNECFRGHEFHFSQMKPLMDKKEFPWAFEFDNNLGGTYVGGYARDNVLASYLHMHFAGQKEAAARFVEKCAAFKSVRESL